MDWTGGTRRRYAGKSKGSAVVQKQKAHFAKARAATGYQVIPATYRQAKAAREHQSHTLQAHGGLEHFRHPQSRETSRGTSGRRQSPPRDVDRIARKSTRLKLDTQKRRKPNAAVTEEEAALNATRERLLARDDWLGLAAARPVRLSFPSNRDQERIGKRRKVDRPKAHKSQQPAFHQHEERHVPFEPLMSGALGHDDIKIKIGTDALLSQTQQSRRSHNSGNTSLRPISTDLISEESMLLKADSDGFEAQEGNINDRIGNFEVVEPEYWRHVERQPEHHEYFDDLIDQDQHRARQDTWANGSEVPINYADGSSRYQDATFHSDINFERAAVANMGQPAYVEDRAATNDHSTGFETESGNNAGADIRHSEHAMMSHAQPCHLTVDSECLRYEPRPQPVIADDYLSPSRPASQRQTVESRQRGEVSHMTPLQRETDGHGIQDDFRWSSSGHHTDPQQPSTAGRTDAEHDEQIWQDLMDVKQAVSTNVSVVGLRSSSFHATQETPSAWTGFRPSHEDHDTDDMLDGPDNLDGHHEFVDTANLPPASHTTSDEASVPISSPSPSHGQILQLVHQNPAAEVAQEEDGQDEIWRQFVVGSQSSQSQSSQAGARRVRTTDTDELLPAQLSTSQPASEQLRSDRMTTGGSICAMHEHTANDSQDDISSRTQIHTSLIGHATTINPEMDVVEKESDPAPRRRRKTTNIHAKLEDINPKGQYEPRKRTEYAPVPRTFTRIRTKASTLAAPRNIYDLATSESEAFSE